MTKPALLTAAALACFAGNSILCRLALAERQIDAGSFAAIRLASGAAILLLLARGRSDGRAAPAKWASAALLFAYAAPFSYAYLELGAATGALILFGLVQITMLGWGVARGERPGALAWLGIALAISGLLGLTLRGQGAPDLLAALAMALAGVAWGAYSLRGRQAGDPIAVTATSFLCSLPFAVVLLAIAFTVTGLHASPRGVALAVASGALASGVGYSIWYAALPLLSATTAAALQLLVPVLAAGVAVVWLGEPMTLRLALASTAILGGVALTQRR